ncbi:hypothetical protein LTR85_005277 [Meristemomyces frigidus]|nr:hypothetical protein LTR85_005277 [Meristemomyces frigidus]
MAPRAPINRQRRNPDRYSRTTPTSESKNRRDIDKAMANDSLPAARTTTAWPALPNQTLRKQATDIATTWPALPDQSVRKQVDVLSTLGTLATLPPEIRLQVFGLVTAPDFKQVFKFEGPHGELQPRAQHSSHLSVLYASRAIRHEAIPSLMSDRVCKITIGLETFTTNFPLRDGLLGPTAWQGANVIFPTFTACKGLDIIVEIPYPRSAVSIGTVRNDVRYVVELLNSSEYALPPVHASLHGTHHDSEVYTYNDYAMMLGPLRRLQRAARGFVVSCSSPLTPGTVDPKCLQQCQLIEAAVAGDMHQSKELLRQQCLFDIKFSLALYQDKEDLKNRFAPSGASGTIGHGYAGNILRALQELKAVLPSSGLMPWAEGLEAAIVAKAGFAVLKRSAVEMMLGGPDICEFLRWASGHQTVRNPYWQ